MDYLLFKYSLPFSALVAAGALSFEDGLKLVYARAMAMQKACELQPSIKAMLRHPSSEMYMMIKDFNPVLLCKDDMYDAWLDICCKFASENNVPLREWIKTKPKFLFSK